MPIVHAGMGWSLTRDGKARPELVRGHIRL